ncbi:MAG: hypothetical protein J0L75_02115 [Spirochaetes bacterium]|nr:hypothetical protein [Spirochaetota bacterium]
MKVPSYILKHWKLGAHLVLATRHFGVNNRWWTPWPSPWGLPLWKQAGSILLIKPFLDRARMMRVRMSHSHGWAPAADYEGLFGPRRLYKK